MMYISTKRGIHAPVTALPDLLSETRHSGTTRACSSKCRKSSRRNLRIVPQSTKGRKHSADLECSQEDFFVSIADPLMLSRRQVSVAAILGHVLGAQVLGASPACATEEIAENEIAASSPAGIRKVFVAGATGNTGRRVVQALRTRGIDVRAGVRDLRKAEALGISITAKGYGKVDLVQFDVTGPIGDLAAAIGDADAVICATGFTPSAANWGGLKPKSSLPVDKQGTINLVDASKQAGGVKHFVLVSSLLTNAVACNQTDNANYKVLQAFGGVLGAKREAESYLQDSGLDYTVVRPGGLSNDPPSGEVFVSGADTLFGASDEAGREISRDSVAEVCVESLFQTAADGKVIEIVQVHAGSGTPKAAWFDFPAAPAKGCATPAV